MTRILQTALGGNSKTGKTKRNHHFFFFSFSHSITLHIFLAIICTVTPAAPYVEETISTLNFASRAKTIQNKPEVNEVVDEHIMLKRLQLEVGDLRKQLSERRVSDTELRMIEADKLRLETEKQDLVVKLNEEKALQKDSQERLARMKQLFLVSTKVIPAQTTSSSFSPQTPNGSLGFSTTSSSMTNTPPSPGSVTMPLLSVSAILSQTDANLQTQTINISNAISTNNNNNNNNANRRETWTPGDFEVHQQRRQQTSNQTNQQQNQNSSSSSQDPNSQQPTAPQKSTFAEIVKLAEHQSVISKQQLKSENERLKSEMEQIQNEKATLERNLQHTNDQFNLKLMDSDQELSNTRKEM